MTRGGSKSGNPWLRLMASCCMQIRVMRRITESVNREVRELSSCIGAPSGPAMGSRPSMQAIGLVIFAGPTYTFDLRRTGDSPQSKRLRNTPRAR